ncbi:ankyrin repeat and SOCS box protein 3-like isoform X2 [Zootermopsis nevadensis]|uniref:ankyrin repeat and SOCS box protein 3-like isoform X2 n=1 Tax=Zootermopsis nevadensis TaxID=136037 RepID=UPI000B8E589A|nr:ankyrin repeat and SOCS box protein 3-like isoform X2 [Zootermopsis nevadensis]
MQFNEANPLAASCLGIAARVGNEKAVQKLLKGGRHVNIGDNRGWTPLHEAAAASNIGCLHLLLKKGRRYVNQRTMEGETPLLLACMHQDSMELVCMLLNHGADVKLGNNENHTPLHEVCKNGKFQLAKILIEARANLNEKNYNDMTPLHFAVSSENATLVNYLISKGADVSIQDEVGRTPLFLASELGNWNVAEPIVTACQSVDTRAVDGATALMLAAQHGNLKLVEELLEKGANPNVAANDHTTALHLAIHSGHLSIVKLLLKVTSRDSLFHQCTHPNADVSRSLCCLAIDSGCLDVLKILLSSDLGNEILHLPVCYDATPKSQPRLELLYSECSPVSFLLSTKMDELKDDIIVYLDLLLSHGFPVNVTKRQSLPPLVAAMLEPSHKHLSSHCVDMLLAHGADIDYTTTCARVPDPLLAACVSGHCSGVLQLLRAGSNGLPDDLLRRLVMHDHLDPPTPMLINVVLLLLKLGITEPDLYCKLQQYFPETSSNIQIKAVAELLAPVQMCSLQQLCRVAVRRCLSQPLSQALKQLPVPHCIKNYLTYETL